ncbi:TetR family transcriptional regulator [Microtetraspora sp. NBRC 13810]|uniref:acyl-CoA-like ligand-binding transcription factor n=1 Tax=Microtetraspora sp. NBRC 13810 TaxID=3030990 RepID=UPI0024A0E3ED|nr:TetR family transcriptional regulator [Microtetraspora sp. NBRC 13810]GLW07363.1 TetR family transcriptional regulator [Microtetraspora sp. NBRC 13810]
MVRLAAERGLENVRIEEIAAEAGVSPRTFNNYFSSKHEAVGYRHVSRMRRSAELLRARPAAEPLWEAITEAVLEPLGRGDRVTRSPGAELLAGLRLLVTEAASDQTHLKIMVTADRDFALAVAERTGTDAERDLYPRLVAAAVSTAVHVATERFLHADPPVPLIVLLREALAQLAAGMPDPSR